MKSFKVVIIVSSILLFYGSFINCSNKSKNDLDVIENYKKQGWQVTDSIDVILSNNEIYGIALILVNDKEVKHCRRLLIFIEDNDNFSLICNNYKIFGGSNWGIQGNEAFSSIYLSPEGLVLSFNTGSIHRELQSYYFDLVGDKLMLVKYLISEYDIRDVDEEGSLIKETIENYDLINNIHSSFKLINGEKLNLIEDGITPKTILIGDIDAENGIKF